MFKYQNTKTNVKFTTSMIDRHLFDTHQYIMWKPLTVWVNVRNKKMHIFEHTYTFREIVLPVSCMAKAHPEKSPLILFQLILNQPRYNVIRKSKTVKTLTLSLLQKVNSPNLLCFNINPPLSQHIFLKLTKHWYQYQNLFIALSYVS